MSTIKKKWYGKVTLFNEDALTFNVNKRFDVILILWVSIAEFTPLEQAFLIKRLYSLLSSRGKLIFDVISSPTTFAKTDVPNEYCLSTHYGKLTTYVPTYWDIHRYAQAARFSYVEAWNYIADNGATRHMYCLHRNLYSFANTNASL